MNKNNCFPDEATFNKIYEECLENASQAPKRVTDACAAMYDAFWEYLDAIQEHEFRYAYQCGYEAAKKESQKPNTPTYLLVGGTAV